MCPSTGVALGWAGLWQEGHLALNVSNWFCRSHSTVATPDKRSKPKQERDIIQFNDDK